MGREEGDECAKVTNGEVGVGLGHWKVRGYRKKGESMGWWPFSRLRNCGRDKLLKGKVDKMCDEIPFKRRQASCKGFGGN